MAPKVFEISDNEQQQSQFSYANSNSLSSSSRNSGDIEDDDESVTSYEAARITIPRRVSVKPRPNDVCFKSKAQNGAVKWREAVRNFSVNTTDFPSWNDDICRLVRDKLRNEHGITRFLVSLDADFFPSKRIRDGKWYLATDRDILERTKARFQENRKRRSEQPSTSVVQEGGSSRNQPILTQPDNARTLYTANDDVDILSHYEKSLQLLCDLRSTLESALETYPPSDAHSWLCKLQSNLFELNDFVQQQLFPDGNQSDVDLQVLEAAFNEQAPQPMDDDQNSYSSFSSDALNRMTDHPYFSSDAFNQMLDDRPSQEFTLTLDDFPPFNYLPRLLDEVSRGVPPIVPMQKALRSAVASRRNCVTSNADFLVVHQPDNDKEPANKPQMPVAPIITNAAKKVDASSPQANTDSTAIMPEIPFTSACNGANGQQEHKILMEKWQSNEMNAQQNAAIPGKNEPRGDERAGSRTLPDDQCGSRQATAAKRGEDSNSTTRPMLSKLLAEMDASDNKQDCVAQKVMPTWKQELLASLSAEEFGYIIAHAPEGAERLRVAELVAKNIHGFTCEHAARAIQQTPFHVSMARRLYPLCASDTITHSKYIFALGGDQDVAVLSNMLSKTLLL